MDVQTPPNCSRVYNPRVPHSLTRKLLETCPWNLLCVNRLKLPIYYIKCLLYVPVSQSELLGHVSYVILVLVRVRKHPRQFRLACVCLQTCLCRCKRLKTSYHYEYRDCTRYMHHLLTLFWLLYPEHAYYASRRQYLSNSTA